MKDDHQHEQLRDTIAKAIADSIGHGMREKCERHADAVMAILDAEGDGGAEGNADVMVCQIGDYAELDKRAWATVIYDDKKVAECYTNEDAELVGAALRVYSTHPARSGVVSDADVDDACRAYIAADRFLLDGAVESMREPMRAALTHFAKGNTMNKQPIVVPDYVSADDANRLYGENFGIDWVYEGRDSKPSPELFAGTADQLNALSIRLPDEDRQWCDTHGMEHSVELADGDCEFPSKGERHE